MPPATPKEPREILELAYRRALQEKSPGAANVPIVVERPKQAGHGDWSTPVALHAAKVEGRKPRDLAQELSASADDYIAAEFPGVFEEKSSIAGPGFINYKLKTANRLQVIRRALQEGGGFGRATAARPQKVQVEFVSANPTGPLHVGHGRQAALGDAIATLLEWQGHQVTREFYYNDAGAQIDKLAWSVQARAKGLKPGDPGWPEEGYAGEYIEDIARDFLSQHKNSSDEKTIREFAVAYLRKEQDEDLKAFGVKFDVYTLESSLYTEGKVEAVVALWKEKQKVFESEGALWLRTTEYGDDKDRVARKSDGSYTYFVPDVAYHVTKWQRGFLKVIDVQGTDHHSTVTRVRAGLQALGLGIPAGYPDYVLHSLVKVMRGGAEVKISKRAGSYVTVRDLIDWVGRDAVRFFLVSRKADTEFVFDVDLAREKSLENPVYYVQYAHARVCSVFAQAGGAARADAPLERLTGEKELALARRLEKFPDVAAAAAQDLAPHAVAFYLRELAAEFHSYYNAERILVEDEALRTARLALCAAVRHTLANGLSLLGVSAPEKMSMAIPRTVPASRKRSGGGFLLGIFVGVLLGLAVSLGIAFYLNKTPIPFLAQKPKQAEKDGQTPPKAPAIAGLPQGSPAPAPGAEKPKFDFYKILPGSEETVSDKELRERMRAARSQSQGQSQQEASKDVYFIQAGSFQNPADADNQKARLAILGFESSVEPANLPDKGTWYRVRLGPYTRIEDINKVRQGLAQNGIDANLVKIKEPQQ